MTASVRRPQTPFDWHQVRRGQGVPTVGVLAGPIGLGVRAWRRWAEAQGRTVCLLTETDPRSLTSGWVRDLLDAADPSAQAVRWLATTAGREEGPLDEEVRRMTRYDLDQFWRTLPTDPAAPTARAAYLILASVVTGVRTDPVRLALDLAADEPAALAVRAFSGLTGLYPPPLWPSLLLVQPPAIPDPAAWAATAIGCLERIATEEPQLPIAVAITWEGYDGLINARPNSRIAALAREGLVELRGVSRNQLEERLRATGVEPPPPATVNRLTAVGLAEEVAEAFIEAARAVRNPTPADAMSDFRSVHERFLYEQLESLPETAGLFRPNRPLPFRHGSQPAEADLLAERPKLVVEVDGGHYHLNQDQYRRDRRKDWLYQRHGYLVLRFLAEDVVDDLEEILTTILDAVALRLPPKR